jgi:hypothetical protein
MQQKNNTNVFIISKNDTTAAMKIQSLTLKKTFKAAKPMSS